MTALEELDGALDPELSVSETRREKLATLRLKEWRLEQEIGKAVYLVAESRREQNRLRKAKSRLQKINCTPS